jgi:hypothetical protein
MAVFSKLPAKALGAMEKRDAIDLEKLHERQKSLEFASGAALRGWQGWFKPRVGWPLARFWDLCCRGGDIAR